MEQERQGVVWLSSCAKCGRDLTNLPGDIAICPYCGVPLKRETTCPNCGKDLSALPNDITACPYCSTPLRKLKPVAQIKAKKGRGKYVLGGVLLIVPAIITLFLIPPLSLLLFGLAGVLIVLGFRGFLEKLEERFSK